MHVLTSDHADRLLQRALANLATEYPFHLVHLATAEADIAPPRRLHPVFFGSYDWHSSVHMHWTLVRCLRRHPSAEQAAAAREHLAARLTGAAIAGECAYFTEPARTGFERPYGWAWLLRLHAELIEAAEDPAAPHAEAAARWRDAVAPLAALIAQRLRVWLPRMQFPVRNGIHGNSAFALQFALHWSLRSGAPDLADAIRARALAWFGTDRAYPAHYEPSGEDFLSPGLCEARLMQQVLDAEAFARWWAAFEPRPTALARWLEPVPVADPADPRIVHLHGLNLARAWCWRSLLRALPARLRAAAAEAAVRQIDAALPSAFVGDYVGTHWLASFALLALDETG